jgi:hypothetical protein
MDLTMTPHIVLIAKDNLFHDLRTFPTFALADVFRDGMLFAWQCNSDAERARFRVYVLSLPSDEMRWKLDGSPGAEQVRAVEAS